MPKLPEERLGELIAALPPAPAGWVQAAVELPAARAAIDGLVQRALEDNAQRQAILADLESALRDAGVSPSDRFLELVRERLAADDG